MPAKNIYHDVVVHALTADGWTITHDPLTLTFGWRDLFVDLGAERLAIGAGQFEIYRTVLAQSEPDRVLYLAVPRHVFETLLAERFGQLIISELRLRLLEFDDEQEKVIQWIN